MLMLLSFNCRVLITRGQILNEVFLQCGIRTFTWVKHHSTSSTTACNAEIYIPQRNDFYIGQFSSTRFTSKGNTQFEKATWRQTQGNNAKYLTCICQLGRNTTVNQ